MSQRDNQSAVLLTSVNAAKYLGVSPGLLRLARVTGEIFKGIKAPPFLKMGRAIRYKKDDLDNWLACQPTYQNTAEVALSLVTTP